MQDQPELRQRAANFVTLSPVSFLQRAAEFFGDRIAVIHGERRYTYAEFYARARRLAHALSKAGIKRGDTVAIDQDGAVFNDFVSAHRDDPSTG